MIKFCYTGILATNGGLNMCGLTVSTSGPMSLDSLASQRQRLYHLFLVYITADKYGIEELMKSSRTEYRGFLQYERVAAAELHATINEIYQNQQQHLPMTLEYDLAADFFGRSIGKLQPLSLLEEIASFPSSFSVKALYMASFIATGD